MTSMEKRAGDSKDSVAAVEAGQSINPLYAKGQERLDKLKETVNNAKSTVSGWFSKGKSFFTEKLNKVALVTASSPEIAVAATDAAAEKVGQFSTAVETKIENAVNAVETKYKEAEQWVGAKKQEAFNWANDKKEQVVQFGKDTVEISAAVAQLAAEVASEKYAEVKEATIAKAAEVKEKIQSKWERLLDYGRTAIAAAEAKRQAIIEKRRAEINAAKFAQMMAMEEAYNGAEADKLQEIDAIRQSRTLLQAKIAELQNSGLYNSSVVAA